MAAAASVIPTLKDELDRKVFETIEFLVNANHRGRMSKAQVSASLDTLFMAVNGLVDKDFIDIITTAQETVGGDKSAVKKHFHNGSTQTLSVSWVPGETKLTFCRRDGGIVIKGFVKEFDTPALAWAAFDSFTMEPKGWVEL